MTTKMTSNDLDQSYTALCHALNDVGEANAQPFLAMLSLALMARTDNAAEVLALIENAKSLSSTHGLTS
jgi:hypothetical protein